MPYTGAPPIAPDTLRFETCPACGYSWRGLPREGRCPECGLSYGHNDFLFRGISRGVSTMSPGRAALWFVAAGALWLGSSLAPYFLFGSSALHQIGIGAMALLWLALVLYLILTSKTHRGHQRSDHFFCNEDGFGPCMVADSGALGDLQLAPWSDVNTYRLEPKTGEWYRLRLGCAEDPTSNRLGQIRLDARIRCTADRIEPFRTFLDRRVGRN